MTSLNYVQPQFCPGHWTKIGFFNYDHDIYTNNSTNNRIFVLRFFNVPRLLDYLAI